MMKFFGGLLVCGVLMALFGVVGMQNTLVSLDSAPISSWNQIEGHYRNRYALVKKLVPAAEDAPGVDNLAIAGVIMAFEEAAQAEVTNDTLHDYAALKEYEEKQVRLWKALKVFFKSIDSITDPKKKAFIKDIGLQLDETADGGAAERWEYNRAVKRFNEAIEKPALIPLVKYSNFRKRVRSDGPVVDPDAAPASSGL